MKENQIKGVMVELLESKNKKSAFEVFLSTEDIPMEVITEKSRTGEARSKINSILVNAKQQYVRIIRAELNQELFKKMAELETIIIQARCTLATETKLTLINQKRGGSETSYVVARASFYNPENVKAEIRVYLGKAEELGSDLTKLSRDTKFMNNAEKLIVNAMIDVMEKGDVFASIKKSVGVKQLMTTEGTSVTEKDDIEKLIEDSKTPVKRTNPYQPGPGKNPNPKSGVPFLGSIVKKKK